MTEPIFSLTIRQQIGAGNLMAVGGRDYLYSDKDGARFLQFTVGRSYLTKIKVTLTPADTYTVEKIKLNRKSLDFKISEKAEDVHADQLGNVVYHMVNK
jgi:hypothetical protein